MTPFEPTRPPPSPGRLVELVAAPAGPETIEGISAASWVKIAVLAGLFLAFNYQKLVLLTDTWMHNDNWTHGFIIPLFSLYLLFSRRHELLAVRREGSYWGLPIVLVGMMLQIMSIFPVNNDWFYWLSMILVVFGLVVFIGGWQLARVTWVPVFYLALAMPFPDSLYSRIAYPLQELAASSSRFILSTFGVNIQQEASALYMVSMGGMPHQVTVAEACSGIQSLMAYMALAVAMAYLEDRSAWKRIAFVVSVVPIAILCNILRVITTCEMFVIDKPEYGQKFMHEATGMLMLIPAFMMLWGVGKLLNLQLFEEVEEDEPAATESPDKRGPGHE